MELNECHSDVSRTAEAQPSLPQDEDIQSQFEEGLTNCSRSIA
jgi:hypothetical protein